jgi:hypothetical protein
MVKKWEISEEWREKEYVNILNLEEHLNLLKSLMSL